MSLTIEIRLDQFVIFAYYIEFSDQYLMNQSKYVGLCREIFDVP